jgi:arsenite methyltransferase
MSTTPRDQPTPHDASRMSADVIAAGWLDAHFAACRPEYEAILRSVGIRPGWRVLDAGCGGGSFLPLLADLVGEKGAVAACDLAPDNVATVRARCAAARLLCPVEVEQASLTALPYPDNAFDAVWCANVLMHLTDAELPDALGELRRVVRPGGIVAVKEQDMALGRMHPADPALSWRQMDAAIRGGATHLAGGMRSGALGSWFRRAGFADVRQRTEVIERAQPLDPATRRFLAEALPAWAANAERLGLPAEDITAWRALSDPASPAYLLDHPDFSYGEAHVVVIGRVPETSETAAPS